MLGLGVSKGLYMHELSCATKLPVLERLLLIIVPTGLSVMSER